MCNFTLVHTLRNLCIKLTIFDDILLSTMTNITSESYEHKHSEGIRGISIQKKPHNCPITAKVAAQQAEILDRVKVLRPTQYNTK